MALNAREVPSNSKPVPPVDAGSYPARLVQLIDLGIQPQSYNGEVKAPKQEIMTTYELLDEFMKDEDDEDITDKPRWFSENFALNSLESELAKSTKRYYSLDPNEEFKGDWTKLISTPCMVTLIQQQGKGPNAGRTYNKIANVSAMRPKEAQKAAELVNEAKVLSLDTPDVDVFLSLPQWVQDKIKGGLEFDGTVLAKALAKNGKKPEAKKKVEVVEDDTIPFEEDKPESEDNW